MRFANYGGRLTLIAGGPDELAGPTGIDIHAASGGRIPTDPDRALQAWAEVVATAPELTSADQTTIEPSRLRSPSPRPRQTFGIGVNYADHGSESGMEIPDVPLVFPKLSTSVTGPFVAGDRLESWIEGIGSMSHAFV